MLVVVAFELAVVAWCSTELDSTPVPLDDRHQPTIISGMSEDSYTVGDVVRRLGISRQRVNVLCEQLGLGSKRVGPQRVRLLSAAEVDQLDRARQLKYARKA